jgi:8-oxo-dGTP pyrophosphatase MutT (NUDIX family)
MTREENLKIKSFEFDNLWNELWKETAKSKTYQKEFNQSKQKFEELKSNDFYGLLTEEKLSMYLEPEWGFPKGRRNISEKNIDCAVREFYEETNYDLSKIHIMERINCLEEEYDGSNQVKYKHVYYIGSSQTDFEEGLNTISHLYEIGDIAWFSVPDALEKLRPYYESRIKIIHQLYFFIINLILDITKCKKQVEL